MILKGVKGKEKQKQDAKTLRKAIAHMEHIADMLESGYYYQSDVFAVIRIPNDIEEEKTGGWITFFSKKTFEMDVKIKVE